MRLLEKQHNNKATHDTWDNYSGGIIAREQSLEEAIRNVAVQATAPDHSFYKIGK